MVFKYRPAIDGLRAIAVSSVVLYHAEIFFKIQETKIQLFSGGFFGVDIFFVISGYLITHFILKKIKDKKFSYLNFYERRARRLLPALFVVMIISIPFAWIIMMPSQLLTFSGSLISALSFVSNFWFFFEDSYLADISALKPFLHTWSLSVEEQFYLIFPVFLCYLTLKLKKNIKIIFSILIFLSISFSIYCSSKFPEANFYLIQSRVWELLVGALIAKIETEKSNQLNILKSQIFTLLGFILIIGSVLFFNDSIQHPSIITIIPIIGTALILKHCYNKVFIDKILSTKILVGTGLISYSLYLWHFPIFAFARIKSNNISDYDKMEHIILAIFLSLLTYFFIEKPFRNFKLISSKVFIKIILFSFCILLITNLYIFVKKGVPERYSPIINNIIDFNYDYKESYQEGTCYIKIKNLNKNNPFKNCINSYENKKKDLFLWGDSHAAHLYAGIDKRYNNNYNIVHRSAATCKPFIEFSKSLENENCKSINEKVFKEILSINPEKLFLSGAWYKKDLIQLKKTIIRLKKENINEIHLVGPSIRWSDPLPKVLLRAYRYKRQIPVYLNDENHYKRSELDKKFELLSKNLKIKYHSPMKILCKNLHCLSKVGDNADSITTWDENHLTKKSSIFLVDKFSD